MKVSVIIPVYRVAPFIERCTRSLMEQSLQDVEFIFVDDASPDESMDIVKRVTSDYKRNVSFICHAVNRGLPAARNTGMEVAKGEFIFHCDADDWVEPSMLETMINAANEEKADFAYCDFFMEFSNNRRVLGGPSFQNPEELVKRGFFAGSLKYNVWNKLIKRSLYHNIGFPEGHNMGEDMTIILIAMRANKCVHISQPLYHYRKDNPNAFSNTFSEKHLEDIRYNSHLVLSAAEKWDVPDKERYLAFFKLNIKLPFLFSPHKEQLILWKSWFPEADRFIEQNKDQAFRTRMVQVLARTGLFPLVQFYTWMVNTIYYK